MKKINSGLVALYEMWPENGMDLFLQPRTALSCKRKWAT